MQPPAPVARSSERKARAAAGWGRILAPPRSRRIREAAHASGAGAGSHCGARRLPALCAWPKASGTARVEWVGFEISSDAET